MPVSECSTWLGICNHGEQTRAGSEKCTGLYACCVHGLQKYTRSWGKRSGLRLLGGRGAASPYLPVWQESIPVFCPVAVASLRLRVLNPSFPRLLFPTFHSISGILCSFHFRFGVFRSPFIPLLDLHVPLLCRFPHPSMETAGRSFHS